MLRMLISWGDRNYAKKGQPVVIELTSLDVPMGFNAPTCHACTDIVPGAVSRVSPKFPASSLSSRGRKCA